MGIDTFERRLDVALTTARPDDLRDVTTGLATHSLVARARDWLAGWQSERPSSGLLQILAANSPVSIGRSPSCEFVLRDDSVSRRHAMLVRDGNRVVITDLGSTNGTFLNGRWVTQAQVEPGDRVRLGRIDLLL